MIYGTRVRQAREFRQVQQGVLASRLDISGGRLSQIEHSESVAVSPDQLEALAANLRMPTRFFQMPPTDELGEGSMRFRAQVKVSKRVRSAARREADMALEVYEHLLDRVEVPSPKVPAFPATTDLEEAAEHARAALGISPDAVIPKAIREVERAGVVVVSVETHVDQHLDGFSSWWGPERQHPVIALSTAMPWDRLRHTVIHELAHLILHRGPGMGDLNGREIERAADHFAGAFLFPRDAALEEMPRTVTLRQLVPLKQRWGVSIGSLLARAGQLNLIDEHQATSLWKQMSARGWRTREPLAELKRWEKPRALRKMAEIVYGDPIDVGALANAVGRFRIDMQAELDRYETTRSDGKNPAVDRELADVIRLSDRRR